MQTAKTIYEAALIAAEAAKVAAMVAAIRSKALKYRAAVMACSRTIFSWVVAAL